jgi:Uma2 family endonuclease
MLLESIPAEQRTVLYNVSWETFEALLRDTGEDRGSRFAYDCGTLEIMTPLFEHENPKIQFDRLLFALAEELKIKIRSAGSTTLKRQRVTKGIEPDSCYYIQNDLYPNSIQTNGRETEIKKTLLSMKLYLL